MAKWADYLISCVWKNNDGVIISVLVHKDDDISMAKGQKISASDVVRHLKNKITFCTIRWNYSSPGFQMGAMVTYETKNGGDYIKTVPNTTTTDNLDNMINGALL